MEMNDYQQMTVEELKSHQDQIELAIHQKEDQKKDQEIDPKIIRALSRMHTRLLNKDEILEFDVKIKLKVGLYAILVDTDIGSQLHSYEVESHPRVEVEVLGNGDKFEDNHRLSDAISESLEDYLTDQDVDDLKDITGSNIKDDVDALRKKINSVVKDNNYDIELLLEAIDL